MVCIFLIGRGKINFGFDESDTEPSFVDPLTKSEGKKLEKGKTRASSLLPEKKDSWCQDYCKQSSKETSG
jgi:hypothetical protein